MAKTKLQPSVSPVVNMSVSLLVEERDSFERKVLEVMGYDRSIKNSRLARIAFKVIEQMDVEEILKIAEDVPNLGSRRGRPPK
jgi:hypothetical protein